MSCVAVQTGNHFLWAVLNQVDCQAQAIGTFGYGALADPNSPVASLLLAALTLFIALFGFRMMFGQVPAGGDLVGAMLKIGIVLTLATSWPTWRTLAHGIVLDGPTEVSSAIGGAAALPGAGRGLNQRLDSVDQGIVALTAFGTGRLTGGIVGSSDLDDSTRGIALADQQGFAWGRVAFLTGTIGPLALVRLAAGILLALAPLMAGLLLFMGTRGIFFGWLRALAACALGAVVLALCYGAELALLESWLRDALNQRQSNVLTPAAPTELLVIALSFAVVAFGALALVIKLMFFASPMWQRLWQHVAAPVTALSRPVPALASSTITSEREMGRVERISDAVAQTMRREEHLFEPRRGMVLASQGTGLDAGRRGGDGPSGHEALGSSFRRGYRRHSSAASKRDQRP